MFYGHAMCIGVLFCSVREFCLQRAIPLLLVVCMNFFAVFFCLQCAGGDFFSRVIYVCKEFFYLRCFLFVKAVSPMGHSVLSNAVIYSVTLCAH